MLEEAIIGIQESAAAAEASESLKQQALDDSAAAEAAESASEQLQEEYHYALSEAEAAEKVAEELSNEGRATESMAAAATAGRCGATAMFSTALKHYYFTTPLCVTSQRF
ncbi:MAG: hypothetical protein HC767_02930 [Akkermansiaceae bacterium]|nr:hypothetical protein [Akkermansiaceae bacterium]